MEERWECLEEGKKVACERLGCEAVEAVLKIRKDWSVAMDVNRKLRDALDAKDMEIARLRNTLIASRRVATIGIREAETEKGSEVCRWCEEEGCKHKIDCPCLRFADIVMMQVDFEHHGREYLKENS